jgi:hypothetical protein
MIEEIEYTPILGNKTSLVPDIINVEAEEIPTNSNNEITNLFRNVIIFTACFAIMSHLRTTNKR